MRQTLLTLARPLVAALLLAFAAVPAAAQGTALVPPTDLAYADVDRLAELGVLDSTIVGQRPFSRREFARIAAAAHVRLDRADRGGESADDDVAMQANGILQRLESRFGDESVTRDAPSDVAFALFDGVSLVYNGTDAIRRGFPASYSRLTEATIDPLAFRRLGDPAVRGQSIALELSQRLEATSWLAFRARERLEYRRPRDSTTTKTEGELLLASVRARLGNVALTIGREQFAWAQTAGTGLFLASDAPALDQISLAGDHPFVLPGVLRVLGPTQATIIFADLGYSQVRSHSELLAYKVSIQPTSSLELGGTFMNHFGGSGGRPSSFGNRLVDFLPFIDIFRRHNYSDTTQTFDVDSDKLLGVDGRLRLARLGGVTVSGEVLIDDFDVHRIPQLLTGYGSSNVAIIIPALGTPDWSLKLSAKHTGILTYTHAVLTNGITTHGRLLGDELGPDAKAFGAELRWIPAAALRLSFEGWSAQYSNAEYTSYYAGPGATNFVVQKVSSSGNELRDRLVAALELQTDDGIAFVVRGGGERIRNANFTGDRRKSYVVEVALRLRQ